MITDESFELLAEEVKALSEGARPVEAAQVALLAAILNELRTIRKANEQLSEQFNIVSLGGNALLMEKV